MYPKDITPKTKDISMNKQITPVDWRGNSSLITIRLNAQARQCDAFTPRRRVSGWTPKMPIAMVGNPIFLELLQIERAHRKHRHAEWFRNFDKFKIPLESDTKWEFNLWLNRLGRVLKSAELFLGETVYTYRNNGINKEDFKRKRHGAVIGRLGRKFTMVYYRGAQSKSI